MVGALKKRRGVSCFVTANIGYYQDHAFKVAIKKEDIPVIVLQKEFPVTNRVAAKFAEHYKGWNPNANVVAVAGDRAKKCLAKCGVADYSDLVVTGFPRLDRYESSDCASANRKKLNFLALSFRSGYGEKVNLVFST
jgi:GTP:adenosylcobinamide-phosphate guanylyltransferase